MRHPHCTEPDCFNPVENQDIGLCATHARLARKQSKGIQQIEVKQKSEQQQLNQYVQLKKKFIRGKECELKGVHFECKGPIDIHHRLGRGNLLMETKYWMVVCRHHHGYITNHPEESYREGWCLLRTANEQHLI